MGAIELSTLFRDPRQIRVLSECQYTAYNIECIECTIP